MIMKKPTSSRTWHYSLLIPKQHWYDKLRTPVTNTQCKFMETIINDFNKNLDVQTYTQLFDREGGYQYQTYHSLDRQRQIAMQLAIWVKEQLTDLKKCIPQIMMNELFQRLHVIVRATQMELSRQVGLHMSNQYNTNRQEEWSRLIDSLSQIQMRTFHQAIGFVSRNQIKQEEEAQKKMDSLHTIYQEKITEMFRRVDVLSEQLFTIKQGIINVNLIHIEEEKKTCLNLYLRKKCLKLEYANHMILIQNDVLRDELLKSEKQNELYSVALQKIHLEQCKQKDDVSMVSRTSLQMNRDELIESTKSIVEKYRVTQTFSSYQNIKNKPALSRSKMASNHYRIVEEPSDTKQLPPSDSKQLPQSETKQIPSSESKQYYSSQKQISPGIKFEVNEHIEQNLFIQNNQDFHNNFIGEMIDKEINTTISLTYGKDQDQQVDWDLQARFCRSVLVMTDNESYDKSTQCHLDGDEKKTLVSLLKRFDDGEQERVEQERRDRRTKLLEQAPKIMIFLVENEETQVEHKQDNLELLAQVKDRVNQLQSDVQEFDSLKVDEKNSLKDQFIQLSAIITQVGRNVTHERNFQNRKDKSLMMQIAERDNEKLQLEYQLDTLQRLAAKLQQGMSNQMVSVSESDSHPSSQSIIQESIDVSHKTSPRGSLQQKIVPRLLIHNLTERSITYNQINQTMIYVHFYLDGQQVIRTFENKENYLKSLFKKLNEVYRTKKGIKSTMDEFTFEHFQEALGVGKRAEQKFNTFIQCMVFSVDPDASTSILVNLISGQFSSLSGRIHIYFSALKLATRILQDVDIQDTELSSQFTSLLREAFAYNSINLKEDDLQLCLKHFLPKARHLLDNKFDRLKRTQSGQDSSSKSKRRPTKRIQSPYQEEDLSQQVLAHRMQISEQNVRGQTEMTQIILDNCFSAIYAQDYILRQMVAFTSSDMLQHSFSLEEFCFITRAIETNTILLQSYTKKFNTLIHKQTQKRNQQMQNRVPFLEFHSLVKDLNLLKLIDDCLKVPIKLIASVVDEIYPDQISVKVHNVQNNDDLYVQWRELQLIMKNRLWVTNTFNGVQHKVIDQLNVLIEIINNKSDNYWDHQFINEKTILWLYWLLVSYSNNKLIEDHVDRCIPEWLLDFSSRSEKK